MKKLFLLVLLVFSAAHISGMEQDRIASDEACFARCHKKWDLLFDKIIFEALDRYNRCVQEGTRDCWQHSRDPLRIAKELNDIKLQICLAKCATIFAKNDA